MSAPSPSYPDVVVGRQPILDRRLATVGYELLFRGPREDALDMGAAERWTASLIADAMGDLGLDALVGGRRAYLNVSERFLTEVDPLPFGPERVVLELLEDSHHAGRELLDRLARLAADGYLIALDDVVYDPSLDPLLESAGVVKLDVLAHGLEGARRQMEHVTGAGVQLLAEKVETYEEFQRCHDVGFDLFQGYFFARPRLVTGRGLPAETLDTLGSLTELVRPGVGFDALERVISADVGLAYKLLRYVNSAFFALSRSAGTVREAMLVLGERAVRQWAVVLALAGANRGPQELVTVALLRARLCEQLGPPGDADARARYFTAGLFSVVDALLDAPLERVLEDLPLSEDVNRALLGHEGPIGEALRRVIAGEQGEPSVPADGGPGYADATRWADGVTRAVS